LVLSYRRKAWLTGLRFFLCRPGRLTRGRNPVLRRMIGPEWAIRPKIALRFRAFQSAGFDERSGFEIRLGPNQCSRMMILVPFGSSSRPMHPDDHRWSMQVSKVSQPWIVPNIPANLYYPTSNPRFHRYHRNQGRKKFVSQRGKQAQPNHVRHRCMDGVLTCVPTLFESSLSQNAPLCCVFEVQLSPHWPV
jgi:hypothetical protein